MTYSEKSANDADVVDSVRANRVRVKARILRSRRGLSEPQDEEPRLRAHTPRSSSGVSSKVEGGLFVLVGLQVANLDTVLYGWSGIAVAVADAHLLERENITDDER